MSIDLYDGSGTATILIPMAKAPRCGSYSLQQLVEGTGWRSRAQRKSATLSCQPCSNPGSSWCGARTTHLRRSTMPEIQETMLVRIKSAGHIPMENDPKAVAGALAESLAAER
jgi:hypothetical protein